MNAVYLRGNVHSVHGFRNRVAWSRGTRVGLLTLVPYIELRRFAVNCSIPMRSVSSSVGRSSGAALSAGVGGRTSDVVARHTLLERGATIVTAGAFVVLVLLAAACPRSLHAQTAWTGAAGTTDYATAGNWAGGVIPGNGNNNGALIGNSSTQSVIYSTATSYTSTGTGKANSLLVGTGANGVGSLTLSGDAGTLTFGGDGYNNAAWIGTTNASGAATGTVTVTAGTLSITGGNDASINLGVHIGGSGVRDGTLIINGGTVEVGRRILVGANSTAAVGTLTISSGLLDMKRTGSSGEGDLGMIRLGSGTNTVNFDGGTAILSGLHITAASNARSNIYFNGTTLRANVNTGDFIVGTAANANLRLKNGGLIMDTAGFNVTIDDALSNAPGHNGSLTKTGAGMLTLSSSGSTFTGNVTVNAGTLSLAAGSNNPNPANSAVGNPGVARTVTVGSGAILQFAANDVMGNAAALPQVTLVVNGGTVTSNGTKFSTLGALQLNGGTLSANNGVNATYQTWSLTNTVTVGGSAPSTISTTGSNAGIHLGSSANNIITFDVADVTASPATDLLVSAPLINRNTGQGGGAGGLVKTGAGTMTLTAANSYTGTTTINAGTLLVNNTSGSGTGTGAVTVNSDATLGGDGIIGGDVSILDGGILSPGMSAGTLNLLDNLTLHDGAVWKWEFLNHSLGSYDQVDGPTLILPAASDARITLDIIGLAGHSVNPHDAFTIFTGDVVNFDAGLFDLVNHSSWTGGWQIALGNSLVLTAIPEPGTWMLLLSALACGLLVRRRRS